VDARAFRRRLVSDLGTDSAALRHRIDAHGRFARYEINDWILGIAKPLPGECVLDLGCGTGKQLVPLAERVGETGVAVGLDCAGEALAAARAAAEAAGQRHVRLVPGRLEEVAAALPPSLAYDLVVCCFALYYSAAPGRTLQEVARRLKPGGRMFVCGPARENNREFVAFCDAVVPRDAQALRREDSLTFMDEAAPELFAAVVPSVAWFRFENPVVFPTPEDVLRYWRSYHLYSPPHEDAFLRALRPHFEAHGAFVTRKVVSGALLR
jgi:SAM-dependent methyltransferase